MRKLSNLFMALSLLCFAVPAFAQGGEAAAASTGSQSPLAFPWPSLPAFARWRKAKPRPQRLKPWHAILQPVLEFSWR